MCGRRTPRFPQQRTMLTFVKVPFAYASGVWRLTKSKPEGKKEGMHSLNPNLFKRKDAKEKMRRSYQPSAHVSPAVPRCTLPAPALPLCTEAVV